MVTWRSLCCSSMMKRPRKVRPSSSLYTPYDLEMAADLSASKGMLRDPKPPCLRGVLTQAKWQKWLSVEQAISSQLMLRNSSARSEKAIISVGQTKVLQWRNSGYCITCRKSTGNKRLILTSREDRRTKWRICPCSLQVRFPWTVHPQLQYPWKREQAFANRGLAFSIQKQRGTERTRESVLVI